MIIALLPKEAVEEISLKLSTDQVLQLFLQIVSTAFTSTPCVMLSDSLTFPKMWYHPVFKILKVTDIENAHIHTYTHIFFPIQSRCASFFAATRKLLLPGFMLSWPFIIGGGVYPGADISTSTQQGSTVLSPVWCCCSRWCKWLAHTIWFIAKNKPPDSDKFSKKKEKITA